MLTKETKENTLWKAYKGWGSTKNSRTVFEELFRSFQKISINNVLQYGHLIPQEKTDEGFDEIKKLDATNNIWYFQESSYKRIPIIQKHIDFNLKPVSPNCNESFVILDENGFQVKNIIPFDFSLEGIYNYELKTKEGVTIDWGVCDWIVDTDSSLLTFNNGVPEGIDANNPPTLSFYQYVGPVGERHYLDAVLLNGKTSFETGCPVVNCSDALKESVKEIHPDFYKNHKFEGSDLTEGIGLQFNKHYEVTEVSTGDPVKGYDDNSHSNVVSLLSHLSGDSDKFLFVSEGHQIGEDYKIEVAPSNSEESYVLVNTRDGFVVVKNEPGIFNLRVNESEEGSIVLLVKDNETSELELFYPRNNIELNFKIPVFVDLITLPPHLKLETSTGVNTDSITPDYYGPRTEDFIVAVYDESENSTTDWRSSDFVVYNKDNFRLSDALSVKGSRPHIYFRNGTYVQDSFVVDENTLHLEGESVYRTVFKTKELLIEGSDNLIENISFENSTIRVEGNTVFSNVSLKENCTLLIKDGCTVVLKNSSITNVENFGVLEVFESELENVTLKGGQSSFHCSNISGSIINNGSELSLYGSYCKELQDNAGTFFLNGSHIQVLNSNESSKNSIINTTNITKVKAIPEYIKIDSSYVTEFDESIKRNVYPDEATIPYYSSFNKRVYAKLPDPLIYDEEKNTIEVKTDTIQHTIFLNEKGELQCRFFSAKEIYIDEPSSMKTQIEEVYKEHADTPLEKDKPTTVDEALVDLYWSKADLKGGKVPIDQLPDSVAYGGLSFVGMWSFEKHNGEYPTFADVDVSSMSDDNYTDLQRGWFFIVEASEKDDDPCYPQTAVDGVEFTAGDWVVFEGRSKTASVDNVRAQPLFNLDPVDKSKNTLLQNKENSDYTSVWTSCQQYAKDKLNGLTSVLFFEDRVDLYKSDNTGFHFVETLPVKYIEGKLDRVTPDIDPYKVVTQIQIGDFLFDVNGTAVRQDNTSYSVLDTQFITKEDYLNGTAKIITRLLLKASNKESQEWAESVFDSTSNGFSLRPTSIDGWWDQSHFESDQPLDLIDKVFVQYARAFNSASLEKEGKWNKLDRAYSDPVYSRLPQTAPVTDGSNVQWSLKDKGTGLLQLSYKTLAEAIRLINEQLLKQSPDRSIIIQKTSLKIDYKKMLDKPIKIFEIDNGFQLNQVTDGSPIEVFESKDSKVFFEIDTSDELPLNRYFYCGKSSNIRVFDNETEITNVSIDRFDPYERHRLGFRTPSGITSAFVNGSTTLGNLEGGRKVHNLKVTQYEVINDDIIDEDSKKFEGETETLSFIEQKIYKLEEVEFIKSKDVDSNFRVLQDIANSHTSGGFRYLPTGTKITTSFTVSNFAKWGVINENANIEVEAKIGEKLLDYEITSRTLRLKNEERGVFDLVVRLEITLPSEEDYYYGYFTVKAIATNGETKEGEVFRLKSLPVINPECLKDVVEGAEVTLYPTLDLTNNSNRNLNFGSSLKNFETETGLPFGEKGFGWPTKSSYISDISLDNENIRVTHFDGLQKGDGIWRFIAFKKSFETIQDICGFNIVFDWGDKLPEINKINGTLEDVILQVAVYSDELPNKEVQNANAVVPVFFNASFTRDEPVNFTGASDPSIRRITFGRKPVPVKDIFIRVGLKKDSDLFFKKLSLAY